MTPTEQARADLDAIETRTNEALAHWFTNHGERLLEEAEARESEMA